MTRHRRYPNSTATLAAAKYWRDNALLERKSIFGFGEIWTASAFDGLVEHYVDNLDEGAGNFTQKLRAQLASAPRESVLLCAELLWAMLLCPDNISSVKKRFTIRDVLSWAKEDLPESDLLMGPDALSGAGSAGTSYNTRRWRELVYAIKLFKQLMALDEAQRLDLLADAGLFRKWCETIPGNESRQFRHMLVFLLFPEENERIFSGKDRRRIVEVFAGLTASQVKQMSPTDIDEQLAVIRKRKEQELNTDEILWYLSPIKDEWNTSPDLEQTIYQAADSDEDGENEISDEAENFQPATPICSIYYGPPGTGKTHIVQQIITRKYETQNYKFVTFHQSYGYEEFVEGLRPVLDGGDQQSDVSYEIRPGVFKELCQLARQTPDKRFAIVIDEINRGNISKIFGELITLIEIDKREGAPNAIEVTLPYSGEAFSVPANIDIIGTMNTADRSLALLDTALRRRFDFIPVLPDARDVEDAPLAGLRVAVDNHEINVPHLLYAINQRIEALYDVDHRIGHAYFTGLRSTPEADRFAALRTIFQNRILPLLEEYFFEDWQKIRLVLADNQKDERFSLIREVSAEDEDLARLFGDNHDLDSFSTVRRFEKQASAFDEVLSYIGIYDPVSARR